MNGSLNVTTATWGRKSEGLFDYHAHSVALRSFTIVGAARIIRREEECAVTSLASKYSTDFECLLTVTLVQGTPHSGQYFVQSDEEAWQVAGRGSSKWPGVSIHAGDQIRFGRTPYKIVSLGLRKIAYNLTDATQILETIDLETESPGKKLGGSCRICLSDEESNDNMLLSPCNCDGSVKFIHLKCLQEWMKSKCEVKTKGCITRCILNQLKCELCKAVLPDKVYYKGRNIEISAFTRPEVPHIVLEEEEVQEDASRTLYVLSFPEGKLMKIGRGRECDIRIRDFAVSRVNSYLRFTNQQFFLEDKGSKFGSLVQLSHPVPITHLPVMFQVNRTLVTIDEPRSSWLKALCCCKGEDSNSSKNQVVDGDEEFVVIERRKNRLDTRVAPFEPAESDSYANMPNCVQD